jgi:hypothetical protein
MKDYQDIYSITLIISEHLERRTRHFRIRAGELLVTLEQVVRAILANDLLIREGTDEATNLYNPK